MELKGLTTGWRQRILPIQRHVTDEYFFHLRKFLQLPFGPQLSLARQLLTHRQLTRDLHLDLQKI